MKFGTLYAYWTHEWTGDYKYFANKVASLGFDILEISAGDLLTMSDGEIDALKKVTDDLGIQITSNIGPAKKYDVASPDAAVRAAGVQFLSDIMKKMDRLDSRALVGVMYTYWPNDFTDLDKDAAWARGVESVKKLGKVAGHLFQPRPRHPQKSGGGCQSRHGFCGGTGLSHLCHLAGAGRLRLYV